MVIKVYISGISGNKEVKKRQQRVLLILDSKNIKYDIVDIAEPGSEEDKDFMQNNSTSNGATISDPNPRHPLPPQIFNDEVYCGDYDLFDMANEVDEMEKFLKLAPGDSTVTSTAEINLENGSSAVSEPKTLETSSHGDDEASNLEETNNEVPKDESQANEDESKDDNQNKNDPQAEETNENQTDEQKLENGNHDKPVENEETPAAESSEQADDDDS